MRLQYANSFSRIPILLRYYAYCNHDGPNRRNWFRHLGEEWDLCDNIGIYRNELFAILSNASVPIRAEMMDERELKRWRKLPRVVTVYRGCDSHNRLGLSWTTKRTVAEKFPFLNRYHAKTPLLLTARVPKSCVVAIKLGRREEEAIVLAGEQHIAAENSLTV